jgi:hypothetical protein
MSRSLNDHPVGGLSQLKKCLCYDNFSSDKKRYGKLDEAVVSDAFVLVPIENYL